MYCRSSCWYVSHIGQPHTIVCCCCCPPAIRLDQISAATALASDDLAHLHLFHEQQHSYAMSMPKRAKLDQILSTMKKEDDRAATQSTAVRTAQPTNPYLTRPVHPESALFIFLNQVRNAALAHVPKGQSMPIETVSEHRTIPWRTLFGSVLFNSI